MQQHEQSSLSTDTDDERRTDEENMFRIFSVELKAYNEDKMNFEISLDKVSVKVSEISLNLSTAAVT